MRYKNEDKIEKIKRRKSFILKVYDI